MCSTGRGERDTQEGGQLRDPCWERIAALFDEPAAPSEPSRAAWMAAVDAATPGLPNEVQGNIETASQRYRKPDPHEYPGLEIRMREVGNLIRDGLPKDVGFIFFTFHFGEGGGMSYMSNAERATAVAAIREWLNVQEDLG